MIYSKKELRAELKKLLGSTSKAIKDEEVMVIVGELLFEFHKQCYGDPLHQQAARKV